MDSKKPTKSTRPKATSSTTSKTTKPTAAKSTKPATSTTTKSTAKPTTSTPTKSTAKSTTSTPTKSTKPTTSTPKRSTKPATSTATKSTNPTTSIPTKSTKTPSKPTSNRPLKPALSSSLKPKSTPPNAKGKSGPQKSKKVEKPEPVKLTDEVEIVKTENLEPEAVKTDESVTENPTNDQSTTGKEQAENTTETKNTTDDPAENPTSENPSDISAVEKPKEKPKRMSSGKAKGRSRFEARFQSIVSLKSLPSRPTSGTHADLEDVEITLEDASKANPSNPDEMWSVVHKSSSHDLIDVKPSKARKGWKTIRLFVSSTFKDFHNEREVLVKQVFPDLRLWCESRKLRLVECDLRWGVPKDTTSEDTIKICLSELDRCYEDNTAPFFLNLAGDRAGWIPKFEDVSLNLAAQYGWVYGLSVTEMEIVHGALRKLNPNALFMIRKADGTDELPAELKKDIFTDEPYLLGKLQKLKTVITDSFPDDSVQRYSVSCSVNKGGDGIDFHGLDGDESIFCKTVYDFFQKRIEECYPLDPTPMDPFQVQREAHETFLQSRATTVLGRDKMIEQIGDYAINGAESLAPLLVVGIAGAGKSALMARCAYNATIASQELKIKLVDVEPEKKCKVFFHFVGATPRSTDLASFLQRLTKEMKPDMLETPSDLDSLVNLAYNLLENAAIDPIVIFVDAINQMDEDKHQYLNRWIPGKLAPNIRMVISTIEGTVSHQTIRAYKSSPTEIICGPLDEESREAIVTNILKIYNKRLDPDQMKVLLTKDGSKYPLWLTLACEELRVYGVFETLHKKIEQLPDDLISLEESVFERFEGETGGELMKACVCMLEVSRHGLLETELLALLGEELNIHVPEYTGESELVIEQKREEETNEENVENIEQTKQNIAKTVQETYVKEKEDDGDKKEGEKKKTKVERKVIKFLPARDWAIIYRNLKPLLRPCGDLGEGRLDFYHRSLSKAVRKRYLSGEENEKKHKYNFWHGVLADYFEGVDDMDRKAEELPYHLEKLMDNNRLMRCLMDWDVFERLYSEEFSIDLLHSWRQCGGFGVASAVYREQLAALRKSDMPLVEYVEVVEKVYGFLRQAGQYTEALTLMEERLNDEIKSLDERPDELADVYQNMALCKSEIDKASTHLNMESLEDNKMIVEYGRKCLKYREELQGFENDYRCALTNIIIAHHLSNIADLHGDASMTAQAFEAIEEANVVFTKLGDLGHMAECAMTKAIIDYDMEFSEKEGYFTNAVEWCLKGYGEKHLLTTRIYLNYGIACEIEGLYDRAFEYFKKLKSVCMAVFGPGHPKTVRAVKTLNEQKYKDMAAAEKRTVPETA